MKKSSVIWLNVGFCCIYVLFLLSSVLVAQHSGAMQMGKANLLYQVLIPIVFYVSYFLTHLVLKNKKNILYAVLFYLILFLYPEFAKLMFGSLYALIYSAEVLNEPHTIWLNFYVLVLSLRTSFWGALFYLGIDWYQKKEQKKELEKQNLQSELKLLKNQINPHFLFNTLNNIDSLIASNPNKASSMLVGLSGMMRYMIYDTNSNISPLSQELQQIKNFIDLQKMQYANPDLIEYSVKGNYENIKVAPMLFIPFIENAFKHCTDKTVKYAIQFSFKIEEKIIYFESKNISNLTQHIEKDSTGGIGLETVKRRLELLYPNKHQLQIDEKNNIFAVSLTLDTQ